MICDLSNCVPCYEQSYSRNRILRQPPGATVTSLKQQVVFETRVAMPKSTIFFPSKLEVEAIF